MATLTIAYLKGHFLNNNESNNLCLLASIRREFGEGDAKMLSLVQLPKGLSPAL